MNNPLLYFDPTGTFGEDFWERVKRGARKVQQAASEFRRGAGDQFGRDLGVNNDLDVENPSLFYFFGRHFGRVGSQAVFNSETSIGIVLLLDGTVNIVGGGGGGLLLAPVTGGCSAIPGVVVVLIGGVEVIVGTPLTVSGLVGTWGNWNNPVVYSSGNGHKLIETGQGPLRTSAGKDSTIKYVEKYWDKGTFAQPEGSAAYHLDKHAKGKTIQEYTRSALDFYKKYRSDARYARWEFDESRGRHLVIEVGDSRGVYLQRGRSDNLLRTVGDSGFEHW